MLPLYPELIYLAFGLFCCRYRTKAKRALLRALLPDGRPSSKHVFQSDLLPDIRSAMSLSIEVKQKRPERSVEPEARSPSLASTTLMVLFAKDAITTLNVVADCVTASFWMGRNRNSVLFDSKSLFQL